MNKKKTTQSNKVNSTEYDERIVDTALDLDGESSYVEIGDSETLNNITEQVTVSLWIKPTDFPKRYTNILFKGNKRVPGIRHRQFTFWIRNDGVVQFDTSPDGQDGQYVLSSSGRLKINEWYHLAGTIDAKNDVMKVYINGTEAGSNSFDGGKHILKTILPLRIGCSHEEEMDFHASFVGQIDEVQIWNIARTETDIRSDMITQLKGDEPGLVAYWKFDKKTDGIISDISPNRNNGRLVGNSELVDYIRPISAISKTQQLAKAAIAYEKVLTRRTNLYDAFRYLAEIYIKTERLSDAEKIYLRALEADLKQSEHNDAISALWQLYTNRDAAEEFITFLEELKPKMEGSSILHELLGDAYKNAGQKEKAELAYTQWINIRKKEVVQHNRASEYHLLAEKLLSRNLFPETALECALNAAGITLNSSYERTLAHAFLVNEMYEEAFQIIADNLDNMLPPHIERRWFIRIVRTGKNVRDKDGYAKMLKELIDVMPHNLSAHFNLIFALAQFHQENGRPEKAKELIQKTGFVVEDAWMTLGPFDNAGEIGFNTEYIPENLPQIDMTVKYEGKNGQVSWQKYTDEILNGHIGLGNKENRCVAYAFATVNLPDEREVELRFYSDSQSKLWINGIETFVQTNSFNRKIHDDIIPVTLQLGKNSILVKFCKQTSSSGFYLRITDTNGKPFDDLKIINLTQN